MEQPGPGRLVTLGNCRKPHPHTCAKLTETTYIRFLNAHGIIGADAFSVIKKQLGITGEYHGCGLGQHAENYQFIKIVL